MCKNVSRNVRRTILRFITQDAAWQHITNNLPNGIGLDDCNVTQGVGGFSICVSIYLDESPAYQDLLSDIGY